MDGLALVELADYFSNVVLLKESNSSNAGGTGREAGCCVRYGHPAQGKDRNFSVASLTQDCEADGLFSLFFKDRPEQDEVRTLLFRFFYVSQ